MGVTGFETEGANGKAGVHAGENGKLALRARGEFAEFVSAGIDFVGYENFVDDGHGGDSLTQRDLNRTMGGEGTRRALKSSDKQRRGERQAA